MILGWGITIAIAIVSVFSFFGGGYILSPWYNTLSDEEKENYSKLKVSVNMGIDFTIFTAALACFMWFLGKDFTDIIKITVSIIFFLFIIFYVVILNRIGLKNCKKK